MEARMCFRIFMPCLFFNNEFSSNAPLLPPKESFLRAQQAIRISTGDYPIWF
jgi:hypothetical protein